ncbi:probable trehalose-phosphate phosphatase 2 [Olea europaea subsp. europaea]|uniref:Trehalose 6-phosphate phosphatase n=1 Tax=Olea europaea subsp. europaea TaxID=158383 RepID=A0A8S0U5C3_OLEEU|nr:probable trehalose-phosphate phosphatase 2 [Olea europaea subsp. europaea]
MVKQSIWWLYRMGLKKLLSKSQIVQPISGKIQEVEPSGPDTEDEKYISWLKEHPCALASFHQMMKPAKGKQIVVFLDYDGTLSPIVNDPNRAFMTDPMRSALNDVARRFPTAIISGRSRDKVYAFVKLDDVYYAGSHGMDIMGPPLQVKYHHDKYQINAQDEKGKEFTIFQPAQEYLPSIEKMLKELKTRTCNITGAFVEDNRFCISVHYRHVLEEVLKHTITWYFLSEKGIYIRLHEVRSSNIQDYEALEQIVWSVLSDYPCFHMTRGKKVMEIRPSIKWNKGDALEYLLDTLGFSNSSNVLPFYLGDDKTDEDAFKVLKRRGLGYPIVVSSVPRETSASYSLHDSSDVLSFLIHLARWGETSA